ncbi:hypothetical protein MBLNU459_g1092t1 [Dothideomycetes sp. NU459]
MTPIKLGLNWDCALSDVSEHARFIRSVDWASTAIGPPQQWPQPLHQMVDLILSDPTPAAIMWGDSLTMVYNEGFTEFAGSKHPRLMGGTPMVEYAEVWEAMFAGIIKRGRETGEATRHKDVCLFLLRHGYLEEVFVTYTFVPILSADKSVIGFYHTAVETTDQALTQRRTQTLLAIGDHATSARTVDEYWEAVLKAFESNHQDVPYVAAYHFRDSSESGSVCSESSGSASQSSAGIRVPRSCTFVGAIGKSVIQLPTSFNVSSEDDDFIVRVRSCFKKGQPVQLNHSDGTLPDWLYEANSERAFGDPCTSALVMPIRPTTGEDFEGKSAIGFLIVGLNPRRKYDRDYERFTRLWSRQLATSAASVMLLEQQISRQVQLTAQLSISARNMKETEARFSRFAELADVAMYIIEPDGVLIYSNRAWREQMRISKPLAEIDTATWMQGIAEESQPTLQQAWSKLMDEQLPQTFEARLNSPWSTIDVVNGEAIARDRWVLCSAFPELAEDGTLKAVWGCNTDISHQKWAESLKEQRLNDVLEAKRQSEAFIDITSHEMRNPLSAIIQCADGITSTLQEARDVAQKTVRTVLSADDVDAILELAQTITLCSQHQTRIVNDILTLSKLDASLLTVSMVATNPISTLEHALKLHQQELRNAKVDSQLHVSESYHSLKIERAYLDPSRLLQVLINLITNAIKFTQYQKLRKITLELGASLTVPNEEDNVEYFVKAPSKLPLPVSEQTPGQDVYITIGVVDTGCGLSEEEMQRLFVKFSQASPRTHVQYGGSGLGLFICKQIIELCGGRIGVSSRPGIGSTFKFFLPVKRAPPEIKVPPSRRSRHLDNVSDQVTAAREAAARSQDHANSKSDAIKDTKHLQNPDYIHPLNRKHSESSNPVVGSAHDSNTLHVLVVEDNLINQKVMAQQLRKAGCIVHVANHGVDALRFLKTTTFARNCGPKAVPLSVILMDQEMPVMDGLTCVKNIRDWQRTGELTRPVPVIAVTANARPEQIQKAKDAGMDDVVTKPVRIKELVPQMYNVVEKMSV